MNGLKLADVESFASASEALRFSRAHTPDLWVINVELDDLSGFDLCRMLKERSAKTPVFLVADEYSPALEQAALAARATLFLCKPAHRDAIRQWIELRSDLPQAAHPQSAVSTSTH